MAGRRSTDADGRRPRAKPSPRSAADGHAQSRPRGSERESCASGASRGEPLCCRASSGRGRPAMRRPSVQPRRSARLAAGEQPTRALPIAQALEPARPRRQRDLKRHRDATDLRQIQSTTAVAPRDDEPRPSRRPSGATADGKQAADTGSQIGRDQRRGVQRRRPLAGHRRARRRRGSGGSGPGNSTPLLLHASRPQPASG